MVGLVKKEGTLGSEKNSSIFSMSAAVESRVLFVFATSARAAA